MNITLIYRPESENARKVEDYIADFERFHPGEKIEVINYDSVDGSRVAQLYGIVEHPAVLALKSDGQLQQAWQGIDRLPLMNDLAYYAQQ